MRPRSFISSCRASTAAACLALALVVLPLSRKAKAEDRADIKSHFYLEDGNRLRVITEYVDVEKDLNAMFTLKLRGIYSTMSGSTPIGTPPTAQALTASPSPDNSIKSLSGASPIPTGGQFKLPVAYIEDDRRAAQGNLIARLDNHTLDLMMFS